MDIHPNYIPLTRPQYQIWLANESCPDKALYTESVLLIFDKTLSPERLNQALNRLVETTETLRIRVTRTKDEPVQYDAGYTPFACRVIPLSGEEELSAVFDAQSHLGIDLYDSSLFCPVIYTLPDKIAVLLRVHHLVADSYAMASVYSRFLAICAGEDPPARSYLSCPARRRPARLWPRSPGRPRLLAGLLQGAEIGRLPHPLPEQASHTIAWSSP